VTARRADRRLFVVAVLVAVPAVIWAGIRLTGGDREPSFTVGDPGVSHVHGLGVNPADDALYIATHHGTFRLGSDKKVERVGESYQDTMGFTVAGADRFLGSGHPDSEGFRRGQPPRLGLIESTDAGKTWRSLSLSGEVDFHGLAFAHGRVFGWDSGSGRFMASSDSRVWETRSALPLNGFAVDPSDEAHIVGSGPEGLLESRDGGRTWAKKPGPTSVVFSWDAAAGLVGVTEDGKVHRSPDGGATWPLAGLHPGSPQALLATPDTWYAAAADEGGTTGIYRSSDGGRNWELYYQDQP
jgi:photosystem II stability/assembly factor-like uncharacterized protein